MSQLVVDNLGAMVRATGDAMAVAIVNQLFFAIVTTMVGVDPLEHVCFYESSNAMVIR